MSLLLEKLSQCIMALGQGCLTLFPRVRNADPSTQACRACKQVAYKAILKVLHADGPQEIKDSWVAMFKIKAPKAWMFSQDPDIIGTFASNIGGVDDDAWTRWWLVNAIGREENTRYPSQRSFFDRVIARHAMNLRAHLPKAVAPGHMSAPLSEVVAASEAARPSSQPVTVQPTVDVGDLQPDVVQTLGDINALPAETFEPPPQDPKPSAPSVDEIRATSGPANQPRRRRVRQDAAGSVVIPEGGVVRGKRISVPKEEPAEQQ
jgi:hypothetical protein